MKKAKRYDDGGLYTGDDPIVKYRMGMTDKVEPESTARDFDASETTAPSMDLSAAKSAPTPSKKEVGKAIAKAAEQEKPESKPAPTKQQKASPKMIQEQPFKSKSGMTGSELRTSLFGSSSNDSPRMRAAKRDRAMDASNYSMKSGGKVSSASKRADGIATKGKTRGKMC